MKAMILAAGLGARMRPLTDNLPKPLLPVENRPLIDWHLQRLVAAGVEDIVINVSYRAEQILAHVGDGSRYGAHIEFSQEGEPALETGGGIANALPLLGDKPFIVINADVWTDYPLARLIADTLSEDDLAHLVLVPNPAHHPRGDFILDGDGRVQAEGYGSRQTFAGISVMSPDLFSGHRKSRFSLVSCLPASDSR